ncbi:hypothetical protein GINT2_002313 [Glugoides intestinalis]
MEASVRLQNELEDIQKTRNYGSYARPNPKSILEWKSQFTHKGYFFALTMVFKKSYPIIPPTIKFDEKVYHPNVYTDNEICLDIISSKWSPSLAIKDIINGLKQLLDNPNPSSPANSAAAELYVNDRKKYEEEVKKCNEKYHRFYKKPVFKEVASIE